MMSEAEILALTYYDKMSVYRPLKTLYRLVKVSFIKGLDGKKIYEDIPCALSSFSNGKSNKNDVNVKVESDYKLFYDPKIKVEKNDTIVCVHEGTRYVLVAGKQYTLPSHAELPILEDKNTA